eukprot:2194728-Ditylum_brightwellii.AAC.1
MEQQWAEKQSNDNDALYNREEILEREKTTRTESMESKITEKTTEKKPTAVKITHETTAERLRNGKVTSALSPTTTLWEDLNETKAATRKDMKQQQSAECDLETEERKSSKRNEKKNSSPNTSEAAATFPDLSSVQTLSDSSHKTSLPTSSNNCKSYLPSNIQNSCPPPKTSFIPTTPKIKTTRTKK